MNTQRTLKLEPIQLPTEIQCQIDYLWAIFDYTDRCLEKNEKNGNILRKSVLMSIEARKAGNELYIKKGHDSKIHSDILKQYTKSIAFAPMDTEELALGYSNRSSFLMHLHRYRESLVDINRALQISKSDELKKKLQARKEKCLKLIHEKNLKEPTNISNSCNHEDQESFASKLLNFKSSAALPCASDSVGLAYNDKFGRHLVATRDIKPGEMLIVEEGYTCYPLEVYLVCTHCLQIAWNGIPCDECVFTIYCTETCKNEAFNEYHDIECPMLKYVYCPNFIIEKNLYERLVTIRLLIKAVKKEGYAKIVEEVCKNENEKNLDALLSDKILQSNKFKSCYNLLSRKKDLESEHEIHEIFTTQIIYFLTEHTDFLVSLLGNDLLQPVSNMNTFTVNPYIVLKLQEILTKLKFIMIINGYLFETLSWQCGCNDLAKCCGQCSLEKGIVIVPCCSLLNHSCTPNVNHLCIPERKIIVFSTSPIKKGEMLCDSYRGISIMEGDLKFRENRLKNSYFTCECRACLDKIDSTMLSDSAEKDLTKVMIEFCKNFPISISNLFFVDSVEDWEMSEAVLEYMVKISQLLHKNFNYYKAFAYSYKCRTYIIKMMSMLYREKNFMPRDC